MTDEPTDSDIQRDDTGPPEGDTERADAGEQIPSKTEVTQIATAAAHKVQADATLKAKDEAAQESYRADLRSTMDEVINADEVTKSMPEWKREAVHRRAATLVRSDNPELNTNDSAAVQEALKKATTKAIGEDAPAAPDIGKEDKEDVKKRVAALDGGAGAGGGRSAGQGSGESEKIIAGGFDNLQGAGLTTEGPGWPTENQIDRDTEKAADKFLAAAPRD